MNKSPFNVKILEPNSYISARNCLPVTSFAMYEPSTTSFHPDGFFSEVIFGQIGSSQRLIKRGYIELRTEVVTPHLFKQIISMKKTLYMGIMKGDTYAVFDKSVKDFVKVPDTDPNAETGYNFFISNIKKVDFQYTDSVQRANKIKLIDKYRDEMLIDKYIVLPAGIRDVRMKNGRPSSEEINKIYLGLLSLANSLPDNHTVDPIFDPIRLQIQMKVVEIYDYIENLMNGKHGFTQGKYSARDIVYSNRNVITAAVMNNADTPDSKRMFSIDEVETPLYQTMKGAVPLVVNNLKTGFFDTVFNPENKTTYLIDRDTLELNSYEVDDESYRKFTTVEGVEKIINDFRNQELHFKPVTIKVVKENGKFDYKYLALIYDTGDKVYYIRNVNDFVESYSRKVEYRDAIPSLSIFDKLGLDKSDFIVEGSCACYSYGMDIKPTDIDIIPNSRALAILNNLPKKDTDKFGDFTVELDNVDVHVKHNLFNVTDDKKFAELKKDTTKINDHYYLSAPTMLERYTSINRVKDKFKIEYLRSIIFDKSKLRPLTYVELCYIATYMALHDKHATATRYPVLNLQGLVVYKLHLMSTAVSRQVTFAQSAGGGGLVLPEYPRMDSPVRASMSLHPATLALYDADHDGDTLTLNILMSKEANQEIEDYINSKLSMLDASGGLIYGLDGSADNVKMAMTFLTFADLSEK